VRGGDLRLQRPRKAQIPTPRHVLVSGSPDRRWYSWLFAGTPGRWQRPPGRRSRPRTNTPAAPTSLRRPPRTTAGPGTRCPRCFATGRRRVSSCRRTESKDTSCPQRHPGPRPVGPLRRRRRRRSARRRRRPVADPRRTQPVSAVPRARTGAVMTRGVRDAPRSSRRPATADVPTTVVPRTVVPRAVVPRLVETTVHARTVGPIDAARTGTGTARTTHGHGASGASARCATGARGSPTRSAATVTRAGTPSSR